MGAFGDTVALERSALRVVTSSVMLAGMYLPVMNPAWFTSDERRFILGVAKDTLATSRSMLTRAVFEFEVSSRLGGQQQSYAMSEWSLVEGQVETDPIAAVIERLKQAYTGRQIIEVTDELTTKLAEGNIEEALTLMKQRAMAIGSSVEASPTVNLYDVDRRQKIIQDKKDHPERYMGIKIGFPTFDLRMGGVFRNELLLIAGITGQGKSTLVKQIAYNIVHLNAGVNVLHVANEEHLEQVEFKYDAVFTEIPYEQFKKASIADADEKRWLEMMRDMNTGKKIGKVFVKEVPAFTDVSLVEQAVRELEGQGHKIDVIIIDHLPHIMPIQKAWGENDERGKAAADCKQLARFLHVAVIVPTQAATELEKKAERGKRASKMDVYGSKAQVHVANTFLIITQRGLDGDDSLQDWQKDVLLLADVKKNRDGPPFPFALKHRVQIGRMEEIDPSRIGLEGSLPSSSIANAVSAVVDDDDDQQPVNRSPVVDEDDPEAEFAALDAEVADALDEAVGDALDKGDAWEPPEDDDKGDAWEPPVEKAVAGSKVVERVVEEKVDVVKIPSSVLARLKGHT